MTSGKDTKSRCTDCVKEGVTTKRVARFPGPRCATHHRMRTSALSDRRHGERIQQLYGITSEEYNKLYKAQGGCCSCCKRATGKTKRLSVDHDHKTGLIRGLVCTLCNKFLGHGRDESEFFIRCADYLESPPAVSVLGKKYVPLGGAHVHGLNPRPEPRRGRRKRR